ncbi:MAG: TatD family hydrolase, partial [Oceanobacter sp.]
VSNSSVVAVGEIGLDYRPGFVEQVDQKTRQLDLFDAQLQIAKSRQKPVILHSVRANDDVAARIRRIGFGYGGVVHAFSGSRQQAEKFLELGLKLGLGGSFTHARAERMRRLIKELPMSSWLLETDAPDMPPAFSSIWRNTPEFIPLLASAASKLSGSSMSEFCHQQWQSLLSVFPTLSNRIKSNHKD